MKEFIKKMEDAGLKDFIAEVGSYNANTVMTDTWALMGSPGRVVVPPPSGDMRPGLLLDDLMKPLPTMRSHALGCLLECRSIYHETRSHPKTTAAIPARGRAQEIAVGD